jgi:hypothetical protein
MSCAFLTLIRQGQDLTHLLFTAFGFTQQQPSTFFWVSLFTMLVDAF